MKLYVTRGGKTIGPVALSVALEAIALGKLKVDDLVSVDGSDWEHAGDVSALAPAFDTIGRHRATEQGEPSMANPSAALHGAEPIQASARGWDASLNAPVPRGKGTARRGVMIVVGAIIATSAAAACFLAGLVFLEIEGPRDSGPSDIAAQGTGTVEGPVETEEAAADSGEAAGPLQCDRPLAEALSGVWQSEGRRLSFISQAQPPVVSLRGVTEVEGSDVGTYQLGPVESDGFAPLTLHFDGFNDLRFHARVMPVSDEGERARCDQLVIMPARGVTRLPAPLALRETWQRVRTEGSRTAEAGERARPANCAAVVRDPNPPLRVRESPRSSSAAVGSVQNGTSLAFVDRRGRWARIEEPVAGWVWTENVRDECPPVANSVDDGVEAEGSRPNILGCWRSALGRQCFHDGGRYFILQHSGPVRGRWSWTGRNRIRIRPSGRRGYYVEWIVTLPSPNVMHQRRPGPAGAGSPHRWQRE